ncbi:MAG: protein kinase [Chitinophagaceae bacterium]|jgi:serine/threonine protein kinase
MSSSASELLTGCVINEWHVIEPLQTFQGQTGGVFSRGYIVQKNGKKAFLKAMDLYKALNAGLKAVESATRQFNFELDLQSLCRDKRLSNIVKLLENGEYDVPTIQTDDEIFKRVYYMIFELADGGDIRRELSFDSYKSDSWKSFVLHRVAVALTQLHKNDIAHQDLKPSNILAFKNENEYKLSDLGRSSSKNHSAPTDSIPFPGDTSYAPPEYKYGFIPNDYHDRRYGSDAYLLGSMISFLYCGLGALSLTLMNLPRQYHSNASGSFADVLPFLINAHTKAIINLKPNLPNEYREELAKIYFELCHPDPQVRGHPITRTLPGKLIGLERYVSRFDFIAKKLKINDRKREIQSAP